MSPCSKHIRALEFAAVSSVVAGALFGLPLLAANNEDPSLSGFDDKYFAEQIIQKFEKIGASGNIYDNKTVNTSAFDLVQYMSDTCYRPTQNDIPSCKAKFGPYFNLKDAMDRGDLAYVLSLRPYFFGVEKLFPGTPEEKTETPMTSTQEVYEQIDLRSHEVWDECQKLSDDRYAQARCFQRNIRLTTMRKDQVRGNVYLD